MDGKKKRPREHIFYEKKQGFLEYCDRFFVLKLLSGKTNGVNLRG